MPFKAWAKLKKQRKPISRPATKPKAGDTPTPLEKGKKVDPDDIRQLRELIRHRYALDVEIWRLSREVKSWDHEMVEAKMTMSDAAMNKIRSIVAGWNKPQNFSTDAEYQRFCDLRNRILEEGKRNWKEQPPWERPQVNGY